MKRIQNKTANVGVFGLGTIGFPIVNLVIRNGFHVIGYDINPQKIRNIIKMMRRSSQTECKDKMSASLMMRLFKSSSNAAEVVRNSDVIIICVPTPVNNGNEPDLSCILEVSSSIGNNLPKNRLIIIESTLPPKATKELIVPLIEHLSRLICGRDFWVAYCPERFTSGKDVTYPVNDNRIIGGYDKKSAKMAKQFFRCITRGKLYLTDSTTAEVAKLSENTYRDVNIAFANELALLCESIGVDVMQVIKLSNTHKRVNIHKPGAGVGGPCLPKDPYLLLSSVKGIEAPFDLIGGSRLVNQFMPDHVLDLVTKALNSVRKDVKDAKIAVLGIAYKGEVNDCRLSPAEPIIKKLINMGAFVVAYDPYTDETFGAKKAESLSEALIGCDCILVLTDHEVFRRTRFEENLHHSSESLVIVDARRIYEPEKVKKIGIKYFGTGYGMAPARDDDTQF